MATTNSFRWDELPDELLLEIFSRLDDRTLFESVPRVCRRWRRISCDTPGVCMSVYSLLYGCSAWHLGRERTTGRSSTSSRRKESRAALWVHRNDAKGAALAAELVTGFRHIVAVTVMDEMHERVAIAVIKNCPQLTSFCGSNVTTDVILSLVRHSPRLTSVELSYAYNRLIDASVIILAQGCPRLTSIQLRSCGSVTDMSVVALARHCQFLTKVNFCQCDQVTDAGVIILAENCTRLTEIDFSWCDLLTDGAVVTLAKNCPCITTVDFDFCYLLTEVAVIALAENCE